MWTVVLAEANSAAVVTAILAGKAVFTGVLLDVFARLLRNINFAFQTGKCCKGHKHSPIAKVY